MKYSQRIFSNFSLLKQSIISFRKKKDHTWNPFQFPFLWLDGNKWWPDVCTWNFFPANLHLTYLIIKMKSMHEIIRHKALIFNNLPPSLSFCEYRRVKISCIQAKQHENFYTLQMSLNFRVIFFLLSWEKGENDSYTPDILSGWKIIIITLIA